jgi:hypothetical protein
MIPTPTTVHHQRALVLVGLQAPRAHNGAACHTHVVVISALPCAGAVGDKRDVRWGLRDEGVAEAPYLEIEDLWWLVTRARNMGERQ